MVVSLLSACGGSGSDTDNVNTQQPEVTSPQPPSTQPQTDPNAKPILAFSVVQSNSCNVKTPDLDARLIIHNSDFSTQSIHEPDENGLLSVEMDTQRATFSLIFKEKFLREDPIAIKAMTFSNASIQDYGEFETVFRDESDDTVCECESILAPNLIDSLDLTGGFIDTNSVKAPFGYRFYDNANQLNIEHCKGIEQSSWPDVVLVGIYNNQMFGERLSAFNPTEGFSPVKPSKQGVAVQVETNKAITFRSGYAYVGDEVPLITRQHWMPDQALNIIPLDEANAYRISVTTSTTDYAGSQGNTLKYFTFGAKSYNTIPTSPVTINMESDESLQKIVKEIDESRLEVNQLSISNTHDIYYISTVLFEESEYEPYFEWTIRQNPQNPLGSIENFSLVGTGIDLIPPTQLGQAQLSFRAIDYENVNGFDEFLDRVKNKTLHRQHHTGFVVKQDIPLSAVPVAN